VTFDIRQSTGLSKTPNTPTAQATAQLPSRHANHFGRWDDWVSQERIRKLTDENKELAANLRKDMDAQRRAASGKPSLASTTKKRGLGSEAPGSSARGSEDRSSVAPPPPPRGTKRAREIEGIDKVCLFMRFCALKFHVVAFCDQRSRDATASHLQALRRISTASHLNDIHAVSSYANSTICSITD
jgi:hypothetical protein